MDRDYSLYRLDSYDAGDGYQSYTSNEPSLIERDYAEERGT